jgi:hypothetical protein
MANEIEDRTGKPTDLHIGYQRMRYPGNDPENGAACLMMWDGSDWHRVVSYARIKKGRELIAACEKSLGRKLTHNRVDLLCDNTEWDYDVCEEVERIISGGPIVTSTYVLEKGHVELFQALGAECLLIEYGGPKPGPSDSDMLIFI